jgi:glutamine synthetase
MMGGVDVAAIDSVVAQCEAAGVRLVRFLWCDNGGIVRGKLVPTEHLAERMRTGVGLTVAMQAMSSLDQLQPVPGMGPVGEVRMVPDPGTCTVLPYAPRAAAMLVDLVDLDGSPSGTCPRSFLTRMAARLEEHGWTMRAAVENEFTLAHADGDGFVPIDSSLCFSTVGMNAAAEVIDAIVDALDAQGIPVEQYYPELGHGQHELSTGHAPVREAADRQVLVRETIRGVAARFGLVASLAPKPWPDQAGNGAHVHWSIWDGERNVLHDPGGRFGLSRTAEHFVAGVLAHLPGLLALTAPSYGSYARLVPQSWSSAFTCWGPDNREASVRVPSTFWGEEEGSTNLEYKPADASANPYLAFGGLIAAGLDGVERELEPPAPLAVDPATMSVLEREAAGAARYPAALRLALACLERDDVLVHALGGSLVTPYVAVRLSEWEAYEHAADDARFAGPFERY